VGEREREFKKMREVWKYRGGSKQPTNKATQHARAIRVFGMQRNARWEGMGVGGGGACWAKGLAKTMAHGSEENPTLGSFRAALSWLSLLFGYPTWRRVGGWGRAGRELSFRLGLFLVCAIGLLAELSCWCSAVGDEGEAAPKGPLKLHTLGRVGILTLVLGLIPYIPLHMRRRPPS